MSSESESDEDYIPVAPEQLSEEGSADEETEKQYEDELVVKTKKRKVAVESKGKKKRKTKKVVQEPETCNEIDNNDVPEINNPEETKKKEEDLWAKFLEGTDSKPKTTGKEANVACTSVSSGSTNNTSKIVAKDSKPSDDQDREKRIFEFAGETIVVENNVIKEKIKKPESSPVAAGSTTGVIKPDTPIPRGKSGGGSSGGLSNILGQINKKGKLSTLEKSKLDWVTYKQEEGIEEEIQSHNKGRNGFLDRRDFLERADMRQYEIERDLRLNRRSNR